MPCQALIFCSLCSCASPPKSPPHPRNIAKRKALAVVLLGSAGGWWLLLRRSMIHNWPEKREVFESIDDVTRRAAGSWASLFLHDMQRQKERIMTRTDHLKASGLIKSGAFHAAQEPPRRSHQADDAGKTDQELRGFP